MTEHTSVPDHGEVLAELDTGVMVLSHDLQVLYANHSWETWLNSGSLCGRDIFDVIGPDDAGVRTALDDLRESKAKSPAYFSLRASGTGETVPLLDCLARTAGNTIVLEGSVRREQNVVAAQDIMRQLASATDISAVLNTLCEIAVQQCGGTGAAVMRVREHQGEVLAATGDMLTARGRTFELHGSLLAEAMRADDIVYESNLVESGRPLMRVIPALEVGPIMVAPLRAQHEALGVLAITRGVHARPFRAEDVEHLRRLADQAAFAVHKSMLLTQAQSADQAKGRFLATMSHELRTPLTALTGYNELLADQVIGPLSESQLDILERMRSVTVHLSAMIEEILSFSSIEEGREHVRPTEFLVPDLVQSAMAVVAPMAEQKRVQIRFSAPRTTVRVISDIDKARQILVNLLGNAVKFTDQGTVTIEVTSRGDAVRIAVTDTGIGIPRDDLARLFKPFAQIDSGLTRRYGGTGLGLYISKRLASMLKGHIEVESTHGKGSTFTVVLPVSPAADATAEFVNS